MTLLDNLSDRAIVMLLFIRRRHREGDTYCIGIDDPWVDAVHELRASGFIPGLEFLAGEHQDWFLVPPPARQRGLV